MSFPRYPNYKDSGIWVTFPYCSLVLPLTLLSAWLLLNKTRPTKKPATSEVPNA